MALLAATATGDAAADLAQMLGRQTPLIGAGVNCAETRHVRVGRWQYQSAAVDLKPN